MLARQASPAAWTVADVPLLDEAAELLGVDDSEQRAARRALERAQRLEAKYAAEVLEITDIADLGMVDAETLAAWNRDNGPALATAERAAADRSWAYGHVIVDEAQELSAMAWRMVLRRNPARSLTVVGDVAQTGSPAGATSWRQMLDPLVRGRWREERLTVNYRTPTEIMTVAADVLASVAPDERPPESVRSEGVPPRAVHVAPGDLAARVARIARDDLAEIGGPDAGRLAVIVSDARAADVAAAIPEAVPGDQPESLDARGRPAHGHAGEGPRVRPRGARRPGRHHRPVPERRPRPVRRDHPCHAPPHGRLRRRTAQLAPRPGTGRSPRKLTPRERARSRPAPAAPGPNRPSAANRPASPTAVPKRLIDRPTAHPN